MGKAAAASDGKSAEDLVRLFAEKDGLKSAKVNSALEAMLEAIKKVQETEKGLEDAHSVS